MQVYEKKTQHMLDKTTDNEPECVTDSTYEMEVIAFSEYNLRIYNFL